MRILFDENVPRKLRQHLIDHSVTTVQEMGWSSYRNGELLKMANGKFDVLITVGKNLRYQNIFTGLDIAVITVLVYINKLINLVPMVDDINRSLNLIKPGQILTIDEKICPTR